MEPNQSINNDIVFRDNTKRSKGMVAGMIILALLAIGGIGFGVWAMMDGNQKVAELNKQLADSNNTSEEQEESGDTTDIAIHKNPVIKSPDSTEKYSSYYNSSDVYGDWDANNVHITVENGSISSCLLQNRVYTASNGYSAHSDKKVEDCNVTGLDGEVYKVVEFGRGQENSYHNIGFIMTDGTVKYVPLYESVKDNNFAIRGTLKIDGNVVDVIEVGVSVVDSPMGGYRSSVFVLSDGSYVTYDDQMLAQ